MSSKEEKELEEAIKVWLGRVILVKYAGYGFFGGSLALIILDSILRLGLPFLTEGMLLGLALIAIGIVAEKVLAQ